MFRMILAAGVLAAGIGMTGTATEAAAGDRYRSHRHHHHHHHHGHRDHFRGDRGRFHIQPYPYYGGSRFGYRNIYRSPGRFYGGPGFGQPFYGRSGLHIGGRNFSFSIIR